MRIYTYASHFELYTQPYWNELSQKPMLCGGKSLRLGLIAEYGRGSFGFIADVGDFANKLLGVSDSDILAHMLQNKQSLRDFAAIKYLSPLRYDNPQNNLAKEANALSEKYSKPITNHSILDTFISYVDDEVYAKILQTSAPRTPADTIAALEELNANLLQVCSSVRDNSILLNERYISMYSTTEIASVTLHNVFEVTPALIALINALEGAGVEIELLYQFEEKPEYSCVSRFLRDIFGVNIYAPSPRYLATHANAAKAIDTYSTIAHYMESKSADVEVAVNARKYNKICGSAGGFLDTAVGRFYAELHNVAERGDMGRLPNLLHAHDNICGNARIFPIHEKLTAYTKNCRTITAIVERVKFLQDNDITNKYNLTIVRRMPFYSLDAEDTHDYIIALTELQSFYREATDIATRRLLDELPTANGECAEIIARQLCAQLLNALPELELEMISITDIKNKLNSYLNYNQEEARFIDITEAAGESLLHEAFAKKKLCLAFASEQDIEAARQILFPEGISPELLTDLGLHKIITWRSLYGDYVNLCICNLHDLHDIKEISYAIASNTFPAAPISHLPTRSSENLHHSASGNYSKNLTVPQESDYEPNITDDVQEVFSACPFRFMLSRLLDESNSYLSAERCRYLYMLLILCETWYNNIGIEKERIAERLSQYSNAYRQVFPFMDAFELDEAERIALRNLTMSSMIQHERLQIFHPRYLRRRAELGDARSSTRRFSFTKRSLFNYIYDSQQEPINPPRAEICKNCPVKDCCMHI